MRRVPEWICLFLFRPVYSLTLLTCALVRINGFSMVYGILALISAIVRRPTPSSITKGTGTFLFFSMLFSGATLLAQSVFQIYVAAATDSSLENCSFLESILRQLGLQKLGSSSAANATRLILPDVMAFVVSLLVYMTSKTLLTTPMIGNDPDPPSKSRLSKLMSQMVIFLGPGIILILMALCGISAPSLLGSIYFLGFLIAITLWACGVQLGRWFALLKGIMLVYNFFHLAATYITQMAFIQDLWNDRFYDGHFHPNNTILIERILGLKRLMYTNCTEPWRVNLHDTNLFTDYLNVAVLILFFYLAGIEIRSTGEERKSARARPVDLEEEDPNIPTTSDRDSLRSHPSPTRNYNSIETGDEQPIRNEDWLSRRSSSLGSLVKESSRRFEAFKAVTVSIAQFVLRQSYVGTLIVMMTWSITYHSWMTMIFLLAACLIWMVPHKRKLCLKLSPLIVFYAECLLTISYIYGFNLTDGELPTRTPEGYDLSEIGFYKVQYPFVRLIVQVAFLLVFLFTLKYSQISGAENLEGTSLETLNALRRASIQATLQYSEIMNRFGNWVMSFLIKYWILVCSLLFLFMALQDAVVYRILYMVMFLCFIISFQISYNFWRMWEKLFWVVVIIYSMVILLAIYILQFKDVMEKVHNSTGMSYDLMRDIGFEKYGTKDLFMNLLTPTSFLIVTILHLHYFQTKFLAISDLERYRTASAPSSSPPGTTEPDVLSAATWKETFIRLISLLHLLYNKLVVLVWRVLEVHMFKVVAMTIFAICAVDVCCLNVILVIAVLVLLPLGFNRLLSFIAMFFSSFIVVARMVYQLNLISEEYFISNCTNYPNSSHQFPIESVNGAHYFGFKKSESMFMEVRMYIILVLLLAFEKIISVHQEQFFNNLHNQKPKPGTIFPGISRKEADAGLISCFKFLANYGFYKFGKEISLLSIVIVMVARMDAISLIHGFFLGLLFLLRRGVCRAIWPGYLTILVILLFVQYLACLGLPPILCIDYPWNIPPLSDHFHTNLKIFLFLPDYIMPPYSIKLIADFFQVLLVYLQLKVFWQENKPEMIQDGGSNDNIVSEVLEGRINPTEDFVLFKDSYLDYLKIGVFYYSFWMTLLLLFISGTSRISLFCLGYLIGCFYFLWYGQDLLLKSINNLNRIWSCMLLYCYAVLMIKCALQVVGCVFMNNLSCLLIQCFDITCIPIFPYITFTPTNKMESGTEDCHMTNNQTSLVWDCISFFFIYFLLRAYKSWYFQHVVNELRVDNELASWGSELINEMTSKRVDTQKKFEANILNNIRLKVDKIRKQMQSQKKPDSKDQEDHYEVIRSGDYYMFDDLTSDPMTSEVADDDSAQPVEPPRKESKPPTVADLFNKALVSGMEAAILMWYDCLKRFSPPTSSTDGSNVGSMMDLVPIEGRDDISDNTNDGDTTSVDSSSQRSPALKKLKIFVKFVGVLCWSSVVHLILFLTGISRDYVCISNNLKQEKLKRKRASMTRPQAEEPALIELELEGITPIIQPHPPSSEPSIKTSSTDPMLEESRFRRNMPILLKLLYAMFEVFLSHSELLCYFAMILNAMVYGSIFSMVFPMATFLWATLTCPRPTKAFWLLAIGYTEALIIIKYVFQFFKFEQVKEPKNVFYWASVLGVTKEEYYAAFDIFLLMCLFFHRSVLKQHGLWRDAETANGKPHTTPEVKDAPAGIIEAAADQPESSSSSSPSTTLRRRKVKKDPEEMSEDKKDDDDPDDDGEEKGVDKSDDLQVDTVHEDNYKDDFESEITRMCCGSSLVQPILLYCKQLKDDTFRAATDVYVFMFLADVITFLIAIFGFSSFGPTDPSISDVMVTTVLKKNKIPSVLLGMLLVQFLFIIIDRAIYLRKQVIFKLIFQIFLVLLIHAWVFFGLPYISQKRFVENTTVQVWYFTKCIYLALSAYQVRCGYPTCILGNFLTKKYNYLNLYGFQLFLIIPFLHELRSLMDWMFTDTTLALTSWLQMEDIYSNVFCVKCNRSAEKRYKTPRGNKRAAIVKYGLGGAMLFLLIFIIWLPLLLFSMSNTIFEPNKPTEAAVTVKIAGFEKIFSMSTQELMQLNRTDFDYIYANFPASTRTFMSSYQENDCFNITLGGESEGVWTISPPAVVDIIKLLTNYDSDVIVQFVISFRRNPLISSEIASAQFERHLKKEEDKKIRKELAALINGTSIRPVDITNMFPRYLVVPASGSVMSADMYFPRQDDISDNDSLTGNLEFELKSDNASGPIRWWSVSEYQVNGSRVIHPKRSFSFTTFNERVAPSGVLSVLNNYGVYGLYLSFVLVISRFLRMYIQGLSYKIMYVELPDPQALLTLCQDIYMVRESREFRLEEELFAQLIFLYRSPETLFKVTKQKQKSD